MKLQNVAALALVAVGAAHLGQKERHQRQQHEVAAMRNQLEWLRHLTTHRDAAQLWAPEDMPVEEYIRLLHVNYQLCMLSLKHRLGLLRGRPLRYCADEVMRRPDGRRYWERLGGIREAEADGDTREIEFTDVMHAAYLRATRTSGAPTRTVPVAE
ncbi:DUF6082 family protein [Streptomyces cellulosae]|uniref:Uncharacterized protein n=1 Tax=Streptomyces thermodiastaticus TaxID=44061 RepID=A0ABU0KPG0_9ACTN|nr:hypothetical protein [Streptomyces thermodiastaticus]WSB39386.1 DUF6082 family protein [Streptomyces cellulosae]WTF18391.1 DUF6082 family protein [Streptomyces cellulosae]